MRILIIDDDPVRAKPVMAAGHDVRIAHGFKQVKFWLQNPHWHPDMICLDNDMPLMSGLDVVQQFGDDMVPLPVRVWSRNNVAAPRIRDNLIDKFLEFDIDPDDADSLVVVQPFDSNRETVYWSKKG
jgi:DNA-binding NtrC family response regulator